MQDLLEINPDVLHGQVEEIGRLSTSASKLHEGNMQGILSASYSQVSGLDQLGEYHGAVVDGGVGSAVVTLQKYAQQVSWLRDGLLATEQALTGQEQLVDRAVQISDQGGHVGEELSHFPARPDQSFEDFDFPIPAVTIPSSLSELSAAFSATDSGAAASTAQSWRSMADNAHQLAENIRLTAWDMDEINKAKAIEGAVQRALEIADAADVFSNNAQSMAASVDAMGQVAEVSAAHVAMAELAIAFIQDPAEQEAAEQAFLQEFMGATFPAAVASVVPPLRNLMKVAPGGAGGGDIRAGMSDVAGKGGLPIVDQIQASSDYLQQLIDNPRDLSAATFSGVNQIAGPAGLNPGTHAASTTSAVASMPHLGADMGAGGVGGSPALSPMGSFSTSLRANPNSTGGAQPAGGLSAAQRALHTTPAFNGRGAGMGGSGAHELGGTSGFGGPMGINGRSRHGDTKNGAASSGSGAIGAGAIGAGARALGAGALGAGAGAFGAGTMAQAGPAAFPGGAASGAGGAGARMMTPFGGMPMAGAGGDSKRSKVKTVTSAVEEEGNMKALLGDLPPVVPGAIGAWVRN